MSEARIELLEERVNDFITILLPSYFQKLNDRITTIETRLETLEQRVNLMLALKQNKVDLTKFTFDLKPL